MNRFLGKKKEQKAVPSLGDITGKMDTRGEGLQEKISKLDQELINYKKQLKVTKSQQGKANIMKRVKQAMQRKRMYEKQLDSLVAQQFNIEQTQFATENIKETADTLAAMKGAAQTLKTQFKDVDMDAIDDLQDDMEEMMELTNEVQEAMGRTYGVPEEIDEDELMGELDALGEELDKELEEEAEVEEVPAYLVSATAEAQKPLQLEASKQEVDEFGLPKVPVKNLV
eukprot:gb/GEZN01018519.1/.p1 GENE.gb/GEZN01018519.1/~~gb/GEZN01018519.1/.p1  ORF type:complete len:227 (-),score=64.54 gb/GEZN01018519.1/:37-717(-)